MPSPTTILGFLLLASKFKWKSKIKLPKQAFFLKFTVFLLKPNVEMLHKAGSKVSLRMLADSKLIHTNFP